MRIPKVYWRAAGEERQGENEHCATARQADLHHEDNVLRNSASDLMYLHCRQYRNNSLLNQNIFFYLRRYDFDLISWHAGLIGFAA
jgi:hypothetical protein